jgi:hypothetical protein
MQKMKRSVALHYGSDCFSPAKSKIAIAADN